LRLSEDLERCRAAWRQPGRLQLFEASYPAFPESAALSPPVPDDSQRVESVQQGIINCSPVLVLHGEHLVDPHRGPFAFAWTLDRCERQESRLPCADETCLAGRLRANRAFSIDRATPFWFQTHRHFFGAYQMGSTRSSSSNFSANSTFRFRCSVQYTS